MAAASVALLLAVAPRYGWHRDELYFLEAGKHLAWGYVDQPPFTPLVARLADEVARHNLVVLRLLPALATAATVLLGALFVRELGGGRRAQVAGAVTVAASGLVLGAGHILSTATFDLTAWMAALLVTARVLRTRDPRWWLGFGTICGLALLNKHLIALLAVAVVGALVVERRWDLLASPWLLAGGALALVLAAPNLLWQADNGWPQVEMAEALSERLATENRATLVPLQLLFLGPWLVPLLVWGPRWLLARDRPTFRPLLWAWPIGLTLTFATGGRPYYAFPLTLVVALAGVVAQEEHRSDLGVLRWLLLASVLTTPLLALPLLPTSMAESSAAVNETIAETIGWRDLVHQVAAVVGELPAEERRDVVLLTLTYGEAGAIDRFGHAHGLPPAHSPHNAYHGFRQPRDDEATVVAVRYPLEALEPHFERCDPAGRVDNAAGVDNEVRGRPILVCRGLRGTWDELWPQMRRLS